MNAMRTGWPQEIQHRRRGIKTGDIPWRGGKPPVSALFNRIGHR
jgi:hypothetical protein